MAKLFSRMVGWTEIHNEDEVITLEKEFDSREEYTQFFEERIQLGYMGDVLWIADLILGGDPHPGVDPVEDDILNVLA